MSAVNRSLRTVTRRIALPRRSTPLATNGFARSAAVAPRVITGAYKSFSTTARTMSGATPPVAGAPAFDPEIKDIADYVHNKPINSELAVSFSPIPLSKSR